MPSNWKKTSIYGCYFREIPTYSDNRGSIHKLYGEMQDKGNTPTIIRWSEAIQTESRAGVIRGLHVPGGSVEGWKLSSCAVGHVNDVLLDLRRNSPTYLNSESRKLTAGSCQVLIAPGVAHAIESISDSIITYFTELTFKDAQEISINPRVLNLWELSLEDRIISKKDEDGITEISYLKEMFSLTNEIRKIAQELEKL